MHYKISLLLGIAALSAIALPSAATAGTPVDQVFQCQRGSVLVGFQGHIGAWIDQFQPVCAPWNPTVRSLGTNYYGDVFGDVKGGSPYVTVAICSPGFVPVALNYSLALPYGPPGHVQNLVAKCASFKDPNAVDTYHPTMGGGDSSRYANACSPGLVANNLTIGLDGINIASLKLECDTPANIMAAAGPGIHITPQHPGSGPRPGPASPGVHVGGLGGLVHPTGTGGSSAPPLPPTPVVAGSNVVEGDWKTTEGPMHLEQDGNKLLGTYTQDSGRITAHRAGPNWIGDWSEGSSHHRCDQPRLGSYYWGRMEFAFTDQNRHFEGVWSYCSAPIAAGTRWTGDRIK